MIAPTAPSSSCGPWPCTCPWSSPSASPCAARSTGGGWRPRCWPRPGTSRPSSRSTFSPSGPGGGRFAAHGGTTAGVPADLWIGWALLWGAVPLLATTTRLPAAAAALVAADLVLMPLAEPAVVLGGSWLVGEAVAVAVALVPGLVLGRWTAVPRRPGGRAALQVVAFTGLLFFVLPALVFEVAGAGWGPLLDRPRWHLVVAAVVLAPAAATALQAVREFATAGGTPFPLDPPTRLVTTGPYAYVANPMQLGATILLAAWGVLLASPEIVAAAAMGAVFSAGLADLERARRPHGPVRRRLAPLPAAGPALAAPAGGRP